MGKSDIPGLQATGMYLNETSLSTSQESDHSCLCCSVPFYLGKLLISKLLVFIQCIIDIL